jgi:hypothetical protein
MKLRLFVLDSLVAQIITLLRVPSYNAASQVVSIAITGIFGDDYGTPVCGGAIANNAINCSVGISVNGIQSAYPSHTYLVDKR